MDQITVTPAASLDPANVQFRPPMEGTSFTGRRGRQTADVGDLVIAVDRVYEAMASGAGEAAVGLAAQRPYDESLLENGPRVGARLMRSLEALRDHRLVGEVRGRGMLAAIEMVVDMAAKTPLPLSAQAATLVFDIAWDHGLIIRSFAQGVLGYAPPLCCKGSRYRRDHTANQGDLGSSIG